MLDTLKHLDLTPMGIEEMVELSSQGTAVQEQFTRLDVAPPDWLADRLRVLNKEIKNRESDRLEMELKQLESEGAADLTAEERRKERREKMEHLKEKLAAR